MSIGQTYENYGRAYYLKNRKKILARTRDYRRKYAKDYYYKKKAQKISSELASKRATEAMAPGGSQDTSNTLFVSESLENRSGETLDTFDDPLPDPDG